MGSKRPILQNAGFTMLEILLVVAMIAILAGIVILAINPSKQLADTRNAQRRSDVSTLVNAIYQYSIDNQGTFPATLPTTATEICGGSDCSGGYIDLRALTTNEKYLIAIPRDPSTPGSSSGSGYFVLRDANNRVTVSAPSAELGVTISSKR